MKNVGNESGRSRAQKLSDYLAGKKGLIAILSGALVLIVAGALLISGFQSRKAEAGAMLAEDIQDSFVEWNMDRENGEKEEAFLNLVNQAQDEYEGSYAEQRALFSRGHFYILKEQWTEASGDFYSLVDTYPESYMAAVSLFNAATTMEKAGNIEMSIEYLQKLVDDYADVAPEVPEALFNLGRLNEGLGNMEEAKAFYDRLVLDFSTSDWTNLAKSRIISLSL